MARSAKLRAKAGSASMPGRRSDCCPGTVPMCCATWRASSLTQPRSAEPLVCCHGIPRKYRPGAAVTPLRCTSRPSSSKTGTWIHEWSSRKPVAQMTAPGLDRPPSSKRTSLPDMSAVRARSWIPCRAGTDSANLRPPGHWHPSTNCAPPAAESLAARYSCVLRCERSLGADAPSASQSARLENPSGTRSLVVRGERLSLTFELVAFGIEAIVRDLSIPYAPRDPRVSLDGVFSVLLSVPRTASRPRARCRHRPG
jgi:hypothetical protein